MRLTPWKIFSALLLLAAAVQRFYYYPRLPQRVAAHFAADGRANGWMPKDLFVVFDVGFLTLFSLLLMILPLVWFSLPRQRINLPHRDYWLATERLSLTTEKVRRYLIKCGLATIGFYLAIMQLLFSANLQERCPPQLTEGIWFGLAAYVALMLWLAVRFLLSFRLPKGEIAAGAAPTPPPRA